MSSNSPTPGPWFANESEMAASSSLVSIRTRNGAYHICDARYNNDRLIAAAPELLGALKAVLEHASLDPNHLHTFGADYQRAKAAIAKAGGKA
jgi:hypothetical protein